MLTILSHGQRHGHIAIPASKSHVHRLLICAALGERETEIICDGISDDIRATADCLNALGADIRLNEGSILIKPIKNVPKGQIELLCGESGSTLRFLMPLVGALGASAVFKMQGRLPQRPLAPFDDALRAHGMKITKTCDELFCTGQLYGGEYILPGNVSSQYISALLMVLPYLDCESKLTVTGNIESSGYIAMTEGVLSASGISFLREENTWHISKGQHFRLPTPYKADGDWSNAAFFLSIGALSEQGVTVSNLSLASLQGDRKVLEILRNFGAKVTADENSVTVCRGSLHGITIDAAAIPDLIPTLCVVAATAEGDTVIKNAARLRLKESDRLKSTAELINSLGGRAIEKDDGLIIFGVPKLSGGIVESHNDHRIAMAGAVASCVCSDTVTVCDSGCVAKSYPRFWDDFTSLKR